MPRTSPQRRAVAVLLAAGLLTAWAPVAVAAPLPADTVVHAADPSTSALSIEAALTATGLVQIRGRLTDGAGRPIGGASLLIRFDGVDFQRVTTLGDGSYTQLGDPQGIDMTAPHTFEAVYGGGPGHAPASASTGTVAPPPPPPPPSGTTPSPTPAAPVGTRFEAALESPDLVVGRGAVVTGRLLADDGGPLPGAIVAVGLDDAARTDTSAITGNDGAFRLDVPVPADKGGKQVTLTVRFDGIEGFAPTTVALVAQVGATPTPSPSTPPSPSPSATATATPSATPVTTASLDDASRGGGIPPGLGVILLTVVGALVATGVVGVLAWRWHTRDIGSR